VLSRACLNLDRISHGDSIYGWDRVPPLAGLVIAGSGAASAVLMVTADAWMNTPAGFISRGGRADEVDPVAAMVLVRVDLLGEPVRVRRRHDEAYVVSVEQRESGHGSQAKPAAIGDG
jgi:hypothetical protein